MARWKIQKISRGPRFRPKHLNTAQFICSDFPPDRGRAGTIGDLRVRHGNDSEEEIHREAFVGLFSAGTLGAQQNSFSLPSLNNALKRGWLYPTGANPLSFS